MTTSHVADLNCSCFITVGNAGIACSLQVTSNELGQISDHLSEISTVRDFVLNIGEGRAICSLKIAQNPINLKWLVELNFWQHLLVCGFHLSTNDTISESVVVLVIFITSHDQHLQQRHLLSETLV